MIREKLSEKAKDTGFKLRGVGATRIEALSDGVFAIAIALLLISTDFPDTFEKLQIFMFDFIPFAATIALLMLIWFQHYIFFQRYGLQDANIVAINTVLLFLILFFVYPLKFLFKTLYTMWFTGIYPNNTGVLDKLFTETIPIDDAPSLMVIYGIGSTMIFLTLSGMYYRAWLVREQLELSELERFDTKTSIKMNLAQGFIPLVSALVALAGIGGRYTFAVSGLVYWLYPVILPIMGTVLGKRRKKLLKSLTDESTV